MVSIRQVVKYNFKVVSIFPCSSSFQRHCPEGRIFVASHLALLVLYIVFIITTAATFADMTGTIYMVARSLLYRAC